MYWLRGILSQVLSVDRKLIEGRKNVESLIEGMISFSIGNELMIRLLGENDKEGKFIKFARVSTHPGLLRTDLHRNQGLVMDILEGAIVYLAGISEEDCGVRQASILASER